jgi:hypothetical protein
MQDIVLAGKIVLVVGVLFILVGAVGRIFVQKYISGTCPPRDTHGPHRLRDLLRASG